MTQQILDHMPSPDRSQDMSADEIAEKLGVQRRTVYRIVEREGWTKHEGLRGRVTYSVPLDFIDQYIAESQKDRGASQGQSQDKSQTISDLVTDTPATDTVPITESLMTAIMADRDARIQKLEESLSGKDQIIDRLRQELTAAKVELAEWKGQAKGKDDVIAAKDGTISAMKSDLSSKDQAINAANAAVMLMEQQRPSLDVSTPKMIEKESSAPKSGRVKWWPFG